MNKFPMQVWVLKGLSKLLICSICSIYTQYTNQNERSENVFHIIIKPWSIATEDDDSVNQDFYESIFSQGNGYMGVRGFLPDSLKKNQYDRCTFLAGFFEYIKPGITDMVNTPDFFSTNIILNGINSNLLSVRAGSVRQELNMQNGLLTRSAELEDSTGNITKIVMERFLSISRKHAAALRYRIKPVNYTGSLIFETGIDGDTANRPIADNQASMNLDVVHLWKDIEVSSKGTHGDIRLKTKYSDREIAEAFILTADWLEKETILPVNGKNYTGGRIETVIKQGETYQFDKFISVFCYRDSCENIMEAAKASAYEAMQLGFDRLLKENEEAWNNKWYYCDVQVDGSEEMQGAIRYNIFQLIQTNAEDDPRVSIGARGIMHGRYKGCYFWDTEIFMLPFFLYTNPKAAKNLLMYRYHTLEDARKSAGYFSLEGARYSWMCSDTGFEQCETWDTGCCEVHITADIAYAIVNYFRATGDTDFMRDYGCEMLLQTARYWKSRITYDESEDEYNMLFVKGPDEYCGVTNNNTYTNYLVIENLKQALEAAAYMESNMPKQWPGLKEKINFKDSEKEKWLDIIAKLKINYDEVQNLYLEDDLFLKLEPINVSDYKTDDVPLYHKLSYDRLQRYRVLKQPDVIMLMLLYPDDFTADQKRAAWDFYEPITLHDSTLSFGAHAQMASQIGDREKAERYFHKSLFLDLHNIMKNTATEGIHTASLGATWQALVMGFGGLRIRKDGLYLENPMLPRPLNKISYRVLFCGELYRVSITQDNAFIVKE